MSSAGFTVAAAPQFNFRATVLSHGWLMLPPFRWDADSETLSYLLQTGSGDIQRLKMSQAAGGVRVGLPDCEQLRPALHAECRAAVKRIFSLDWDLSAFYQAMRAHEGYEWLEAERRGRILVCPSLWEDLAKVLLTTNCSWSQTINMTSQLCQLGAPHPAIPGWCAFPAPQRVADLSLDDLSEAVRAGYRRAYLHEMAQRIAKGDIDLERWHALDSDALFKAAKSLKGFGDYAAGTVARMLGHFDRIAIDTACHAMFAARYNDGVKGSEADIKAHYAQFGRWQGLVMWMDIMRHNSS
ncbi:MAG: 3-methyladenine DNA glycosylase [Anaerolineae bacterium]|nr:3-methyladenine DNA glycosylase [Anaerolineae bacterium]